MQNKMFQLQSPDEKRDKLESVLGRKTNHLLSKFQTQQILNEINLRRQYGIQVHIGPETFFSTCCFFAVTKEIGIPEKSLWQHKIWDYRRYLYLNPSFSPKRLPAAVVMTRCRTAGTRQVFTNLIHIYLPKYEMRNVALKQSRVTNKTCLIFYIVSAFALIAFALRAWPILLLLLVVLTGAGLCWCWLWIFEEQTPTQFSAHIAKATVSPTTGFARRSIKILRIFPDAKWVWLTPCRWPRCGKAVLCPFSFRSQAVSKKHRFTWRRRVWPFAGRNQRESVFCYQGEGGTQHIGRLQPYGIPVGRIPKSFSQRKL